MECLNTYVRLFTSDGEIKDNNIIRGFLVRNGWLYEFTYTEVAPVSFSDASQIVIPVKDSASFGYDGYHIWGSLQSNGRERLITSARIVSYISIDGDMTYTRAMSVHKLAVEEAVYDSSGFFWTYKILPQFFGRRTKETLEAPYIKFVLTGPSYINSKSIQNEFDPNVYKVLVPNRDTLAVQLKNLIFKKI